MDYTKHYWNLISKAKNRSQKEGTYYEKHHVVMVSEGGPNISSNIVLLTGREHFVAHWLLFREDPTSYVRAEAFRMMCDVDPSQGKRRYVPSSRVIEEARKASAELKSKLYRQKCWVKKDGEQKYIFIEEREFYLEQGWEKGKNFKHSQETKDKIKQSRLEEAPRGQEFRDKISTIVLQRYQESPEKWKRSDETKAKLSKAGCKNWENAEIRAKLVLARTKKVQCPYCEKQGATQIMKRWHFEKCKNKK